MNTRLVGFGLALVVVSACRPRQVDVRTSPPSQTQQNQASVQVSNGLGQAVNVYVVLNGTDTFLRQVAANASATIPAQGFASGQAVTLKAVTLDGVRTYQKQNVTLSGTVQFQLP